jgi:lysine-specific demethylase 8
MHAYGEKKGGEEENDGGDGNEGGASLAETYMTNTSTVPIFRGDDDADGDSDGTPDADADSHADSRTRTLQTRFPAFFEHVHPHAMEAVLNPGDLLVMPPGWWHAMRGEGTGSCWSVSFWF